MLASIIVSIIGVISVLILCWFIVKTLAFPFNSDVIVLLVPIDMEIDIKLKKLISVFGENNMSPKIYALSNGAGQEALTMAKLLESEFEFFKVVDEKELAEVLKNADKSGIL